MSTRKNKYLVLFKESFEDMRDLSSEDIINSLDVGTVTTFSRSMARWKAAGEFPAEWEPLAVFMQTEIDMLTYIYYKVSKKEACTWMRYIFKNACINNEGFYGLTSDKTDNPDEHFLNVVALIVHIDQSTKEQFPASRGEVYPEYIIEREIAMADIIEELPDTDAEAFE